MAAGVELLIDGNLISLACHLVVPLCERGAIVAYEAKSVCLHPTSLSENAEAEFFLNDVAVEGPWFRHKFRIKSNQKLTATAKYLFSLRLQFNKSLKLVYSFSSVV